MRRISQECTELDTTWGGLNLLEGEKFERWQTMVLALSSREHARRALSEAVSELGGGLGMLNEAVNFHR